MRNFKTRVRLVFGKLRQTVDRRENHGFYDGAARSIITTRTPTTANAGTIVGFYADVRSAGAVGNADNLRIVSVPEPTSAAVIGLAGLAALCVRRRK